jgi:hypothetical protein
MTKDDDKLGSCRTGRRDVLRNPPPRRQGVSLAEVERAIADLVDMGLVADSGRRRNGRIVWEVTPLGIKLAKNAPDLLEAMLAGGAGAKQ